MTNINIDKIVKDIIDMESGKCVGEVNWSFIFDMENIVPELVNSEMIILNPLFLSKIPDEWHNVRDFFKKYLGNKKEVFLAVSHVFEKGDEYTISGTLKKGARPLAYHKIIFFDYHRIFSHYITCIITNQKGNFRFSFNQSFLHHHRRRKKELPVPDLIVKIFSWRDRKFRLIKKMAIPLAKKQIKLIKPDEMILSLGDLVLPD
jgi:hypothetical protein